MSKLFKTMWNKSTAPKGKESEAQQQHSSNNSNEDEYDERPFDIDFKNIWKYDTEELCDYILQYERYVADLRKKYGGMHQEYFVLKDKVAMFDKERKRLMEELEQYKLQVQNLKIFIEEQNKAAAQQKSGQLSNIETKSQKLPSSKTDLSDAPSSTNIKGDFDGLVKRFLCVDKVLSSAGLVEIQTASATIMNRVEMLVETFANLKKSNAQSNTPLQTEEASQFESEYSPEPREETEEYEEEESEAKHDEGDLYTIGEQLRLDVLKVGSEVDAEAQSILAHLNALVSKLRETETRMSAGLRAELQKMARESAETASNSTSASVSATPTATPSANTTIQSDFGNNNEAQTLISALEAQNNELKKVCLDYEKKLKDAEEESAARFEDFKKRVEVELKRRTLEDKKVMEELVNQNQLLDNENADMEDELATLLREKADAKERMDRLEKALLDAKEVEKSLENNIIKSQDEVDKKNRDLHEAHGKIEALQKTINDLERAKSNLSEEVRIIKQELSTSMSGQQQNSEQIQMEIANFRIEANVSKDNIDKLEKMNANFEAKKTDIENKLIQERLKLDQIKRDLTKTEENYKESRDHLTQQVGKHQDDLKRLEHLEAELGETRKKNREYKKNARKNLLQIKTLESQLQEELANKAKLEEEIAKKKSDEKNSEEGSSPRSGEIASKSIQIIKLTTENHELRDKNEQIAAELAKLREGNEQIDSSLRDERKQLILLKEKREAGVKEIKRLNGIIEYLRGGNSAASVKSSHTDESDSGRSKIVVDIKKNLEGLYKEYITSIQYEKLEKQNSGGQKPQKSIVQGILLPESIVKIEKRINDIIMFVEDYMENSSTLSR